MKNIETIETFENTVDDSIFDSENFPIKDRSSNPARRKKAYFKSKKRFDALADHGITFKPEWTQMLHGFARKNSILMKDNATTASFKTNRGTVRRLLSADDKIAEYTMTK